MKKMIILFLVVILQIVAIPVTTAATDQTDPMLAEIFKGYEEFIPLFTNPGLKPGDLLNVTAQTGKVVGGIHVWDQSDVFHYWTLTPGYILYDGRYPQWDFMIIGDGLEFTSDVVITYSDGTRTVATHRTYTDGEHATLFLDSSKSHLYAEIFVKMSLVKHRPGDYTFRPEEHTYVAQIVEARIGRATTYNSSNVMTTHRPARSGGAGSIHEIVRVTPQDPWSPIVEAIEWPIVPAGGVRPNVPPDVPPTITINPPSEWARVAVERAESLRLMPNYFHLNLQKATTRAEFTTIAVNLIERLQGEIQGRVIFTDINEIRTEEAVSVEKAAYIGLVAGVGNGRFDPSSALTREQAAVMLTRLANILGEPFPEGAPTFADNNMISSWAVDGVGRAQAAGIMAGVGNNRFAPRDPYTIEQSVVTIMRMYDLVDDL